MIDASRPGRNVARTFLPAAETVSAAVAATMAASLEDTVALLLRAPSMPEDWPAYVAELDASETEQVRELANRFAVDIQRSEIAGVTVRSVTPPTPLAERADWTLIHWHGGAYVAGAGTAGVGEAILMAHHARAAVVSIDYRMPPAHPFPAAVNDSLAVWRSLSAAYPPERTAFFGTSTGGALCFATALAARAAGLPLPAALVANTPWSDLTATGDSYQTNRYVDCAAPCYDGLLERAALLYAGQQDLKSPLLSPLYADLRGLPPTLLCTGTRDLFLSCTVRMHRALRAAGGMADLHVFEGISHGQLCGLVDSPESAEAFREMIAFLESHL